MKHHLFTILLFVFLNFIGSSFAFSKIAVFELTNESLNYQLFEGTISVNNEIQPIILILENSESSKQRGFWISNGYYEGKKELIGTFEKNIATYELKYKDELSISFQVSNGKLIGNWSLRNDDDSLSNFVGDLALNFVMNVQKLPEKSEILKYSNAYDVYTVDDPSMEIQINENLELLAINEQTFLFNFYTSYFSDFSKRFFSGIIKMKSKTEGVYFDETINYLINFEIFKESVTIKFENINQLLYTKIVLQLPIFYRE